MIKPTLSADLAAGQVQAVFADLVHTLKTIDPSVVEQELDQARKRDVRAYLDALNDGIGTLSGLLDAAADQVDQFAGDTERINQASGLITEAHELLTQVSDTLD